MKMEDRRIFARINIKLPIRFLNPVSGAESHAQTIDISAEGVGLITDNSLPANAKLEMWLDIPDHRQPLFLQGEVVWTQEMTEGSMHRAGVHLAKDDFIGLARILWSNKSG